MPGRLLACVLTAAALGGCSPGGSATPSQTPSTAPAPTPVVALAPPAQAILATAASLPLVASQDHLSAAEYAAAQPDQVVALEQVTGWGWSDASRRTWAGGGRSVTDLVLRTDRASGAQAAVATWAADASTAPFASGPCPASVAGLDECRLGTAGGRAIVAGRLESEAFRIDADAVDAAALAAEQAARLHAS